MEIIKHDVAREINYFDLEDFVSNIHLNKNVLEHMQETNLNFDKYFKKLSKYDDEFQLYFWISLAYDEIKNSNFVEYHNLKKFDFNEKNLFFDSLNISNNRIHNIHKFVMKDQNDDNAGRYRTNEVKVSNIEKDKEEIFWYGVKAKDVKNFMNSFIKIYKSNSMSVLDSNPFLKSALIHLLFVKIHPYHDGNGRTARTLHNIKFTEILNRIYKMNLKICPVNLSESINVNLITYINALDNTYFDLEHDNNEILNYWFNFILNMYDEQLFSKQIMIDDMENVMERIINVKDRIDQDLVEKIQKIKVRNK
ncbi:MAG: Fic family protein [Bacilli bacterium]